MSKIDTHVHDKPRPLAEIRNACVTFGNVRALDRINLVIHGGRHLLIRGGNGSGKSTLLRLLRGEQWTDQIRAPGGGIGSSGHVIWHTPDGPDCSPIAGRRMTSLVSAVTQERIVRQAWKITGEELVAGGLADTPFLRSSEIHAHREAVRTTAAQLNAQTLLSRQIPTLSQGQLRLLLVARALIGRPALLLLDEVSEGLDREGRHRLLEALEAAAVLSTLVMTTHRPETLPSWVRADVNMAHGRITGEKGHVPTSRNDNSRAEPEKNPNTGTGEHDAVIRALLSRRSGGVGVSLSRVTVYIDGTPVLHELDWEIRPGENWAVVGGNGAGKSTLLRLLAGDECVALGGTIRYRFPCTASFCAPGDRGGASPIPSPPDLGSVRRAVHLVSDLQQASYEYNLTGEELVFSGMDNTVGVYRSAGEREKAEVAALLHLVGAEHLATRSMRSCSSGELRRLLLARALAGSPELLLLDEPFSGLDARGRESFSSVLGTLADHGVQMIMVTHHPGDVLPVVSRTLHLEDGRRVCVRH